MESLPLSNNKPKGTCPKCREKVEAIVIEENFFRRDKCQCPNCNAIIYACRTPNCSNYALGRNNYDDELCRKCMKDLKKEVNGIYKESKKVILPSILLAVAAGIKIAVDRASSAADMASKQENK